VKKAFFLAPLLLLASRSLEAAPITFNTALPVSRGEFIIRQQLVVKRASLGKNNASDVAIKKQDTSLVSTVVYGVTPEWTLFATLPYVNRELRNSSPNIRETKGIGDSLLLARYTLYKNDFQGGSFRIAPFFGVRLPTGRSNKQDQFGVLPRGVQPGAGANGRFVGLVATYGTYDWEVDGQLSFTSNSGANNFEQGDQFKADISFQYRLFPMKLSNNQSYFINGVLEFNVTDKGKNMIGDQAVPSSGGAAVVLSPGLQYVSERIILEAAVSLPVKQPAGETRLKLDSVFRMGFRVNF